MGISHLEVGRYVQIHSFSHQIPTSRIMICEYNPDEEYDSTNQTHYDED